MSYGAIITHLSSLSIPSVREVYVLESMFIISTSLVSAEAAIWLSKVSPTISNSFKYYDHRKQKNMLDLIVRNHY